MRVLCPHCGADNAKRILQRGTCKACGKALPWALPREVLYAARRLWKPALVLGLVLAASVAAQQVKHKQGVRHSPTLLDINDVLKK